MNRNPNSARLAKEISTRPLDDQPKGRYTLLTGGTGLVGRYLIRDLFEHGRNLAVLVRSSSRLTAVQRVENILQKWENESGKTLPRPVVFEGDINEPELGLDEKQVDWLTENCDTVIHNAAVLKFSGSSLEHEPWRTNLTGTKNVLALANRANIKNLHYVSTAYVCGTRADIVHEDELECGQEFRNDYEQSKYRAEQLVHEADGFSSKTIYRPGVIVGDSKTGYTSTYHGLYLYLRLIATLVPQQPRDADGKLQTPIQLPINGDEPRNLVPVDWVSKVIAHVVCTPEGHGRTYHLIPDKCMTAKELLDHCYAYFNSTGVKFSGEEQPSALESAQSDFAKIFLASAQIYEDYLSTDPDFDKSNVLEFAGHIACPEIDREMVFRFIEFGQKDKWGKRRERAPEVTNWFSSELENVVEGFNHSGAVEKGESVGLNITGPGGGQWHLYKNGDGKFHVSEGLPNQAVSTLNLENRHIESVTLDAENPSETMAKVWQALFQQLLCPVG